MEFKRHRRPLVTAAVTLCALLGAWYGYSRVAYNNWKLSPSVLGAPVHPSKAIAGRYQGVMKLCVFWRCQKIGIVTETQWARDAVLLEQGMRYENGETVNTRSHGHAVENAIAWDRPGAAQTVDSRTLHYFERGATGEVDYPLGGTIYLVQDRWDFPETRGPGEYLVRHRQRYYGWGFIVGYAEAEYTVTPPSMLPRKALIKLFTP